MCSELPSYIVSMNIMVCSPLLPVQSDITKMTQCKIKCHLTTTQDKKCPKINLRLDNVNGCEKNYVYIVYTYIYRKKDGQL